MSLSFNAKKHNYNRASDTNFTRKLLRPFRTMSDSQSYCTPIVKKVPERRTGRITPHEDQLQMTTQHRMMTYSDSDPRVKGRGVRSLLQVSLHLQVGIISQASKVYDKNFITANETANVETMIQK